MSKTVKNDTRQPEDCPTAWFAMLERARQTNDFELAAQAQRELKRLGVKVKYMPARKARAANDRGDEKGRGDNGH